MKSPAEATREEALYASSPLTFSSIAESQLRRDGMGLTGYTPRLSSILRDRTLEPLGPMPGPLRRYLAEDRCFPA